MHSILEKRFFSACVPRVSTWNHSAAYSRLPAHRSTCLWIIHVRS